MCHWTVRHDGQPLLLELLLALFRLSRLVYLVSLTACDLDRVRVLQTDQAGILTCAASVAAEDQVDTNDLEFDRAFFHELGLLRQEFTADVIEAQRWYSPLDLGHTHIFKCRYIYDTRRHHPILHF